jgi:hypothetical protein
MKKHSGGFHLHIFKFASKGRVWSWLLEFIWTVGCSGQTSYPGPAFTILLFAMRPCLFERRQLTLLLQVKDKLVNVGLYWTSRQVRQIFKVRAVRKPDVFLPGSWTFNRRIKIEYKEKSKKQKNKKQCKIYFFKINFFYFWQQICVQSPYLMRIDNPYLVGKKYKSGFSPVCQDLSGKFVRPVLYGQETHMPSQVKP